MDPSLVDALIALVALSAMEIILGIDNIVFIAILSARLPTEQQPRARKLGLAAALISRLLLLLAISWVIRLDTPFMHLSATFGDFGFSEHVDGISVKDLILVIGGLFLVAKSTREIHEKIEGEHDRDAGDKPVTFTSVIIQIAILDLIFSLDSVITAVGMVDAEHAWVMYVAVILAVGVMMVFANPISEFVERHPTVKMLALSFLILIGVMLIAEGIGTPIAKGYIYFAMAFSLIVEFLNMRMRKRFIAPSSGPGALERRKK